ncbi:protein STPG4 isoform X2 [Hyla sarda]|uniref:protein STPG4 isoform X2 n=1 Tax=Hyla sarda TaxID=327740 RepID=UPI0024C32EA6|nr:protein STPG4 isoform X2 [Hyla sarda]
MISTFGVQPYSPPIDPDSEQEKQFTERDAWWLYSFRESPCPGTYNVRDFLQDAKLNPVQQTYSFKGQGRKKPLSAAGSGEALLPGCYKIPEFGDLVEQLPRLSSFRSTSRSAPLLGVKDKDINTDPGQYNLVPPLVEQQQCKHFMFRSAVQRFPTIYFIPREGPGPGNYNLKYTSSPSISSSFKSSVPRFRSTYSKTPGPGTYDPMRQLPKQPPTVAKMGREHGLFFRNSFDF